MFQDTIIIKLTSENDSWFFTGVYVSPTYSKRLELWDYLISLRNDIIDPWLMMGDINEIIFLVNKREVILTNLQLIIFFKCWILVIWLMCPLLGEFTLGPRSVLGRGESLKNLIEG